MEKYPVNKNNVKFYGRYDIKEDITWLTFSGSAIEFQHIGKHLSVTLVGDNSIYTSDFTHYAIYINDVLFVDTLMATPKKDITIVNNDSEVTSIIKIIKLSEGCYGSLGIQCISCDTSIKPTPKKDLKIEFIGDSITCGYGVETSSFDVPFSTKTENFMKSYAYLVAEKLNADYSVISYSGYGVQSGYTSDGCINNVCILPKYYCNIFGRHESTERWDFSNNIDNDLVVLNLGTNDSIYIKYDVENRSIEFLDAYIKFLKVVREKNPNAHILCVVGLMDCGKVYSLIEKAVQQHIKNLHDDKISTYEISIQDEVNGFASDYHPSAKSHKICADTLVNVIRKILN